MSFSKRISTPSLLCFVSEQKNAVSDSIISVSKKVQKSAVKRNRMKRILRPAIQTIFPSLPASVHVLIVVKKDCSMKKTGDMIKELEILKTV